MSTAIESRYWARRLSWLLLTLLLPGAAWAQRPAYYPAPPRPAPPPRMPPPTAVVPYQPIKAPRPMPLPGQPGGPPLVRPQPAPDFRRAEGRYQLNDGTWEDGKLVFDGKKLTVRTPAGEENRRLGPDELLQVTFAEQDTFVVVDGFVNPYNNEQVVADFARREFHSGGFEVFTYYHAAARPVLLLRHRGETRLVPRKRKDFYLFVEDLMADDVELMAQVNAGQYAHHDLPRLLEEYLERKRH